MSDNDDKIDKETAARLEARRKANGDLNTALLHVPKKPFLFARALIDVAETHKDPLVRYLALERYTDTVQEKGLVPWAEDIKRLENIEITAPTSLIKFATRSALAYLGSPELIMLQHRLDTHLGMPKGFTQNPELFKYELTDIDRCRQECLKIVRAEGDTGMRVAAIHAWETFATNPYEVPVPPIEAVHMASLMRHAVPEIAKAAKHVVADYLTITIFDNRSKPAP